MEGLKNFLQWINDNWSLIVVCAGLCLAIYRKVVSWLRLSEDEKINIAKEKLRETILKYISDAEFEYVEIAQSGSLKRAEVIAQIYKDYPILGKVVDQAALVAYIDKLIDDALPTLKDVLDNATSNEDDFE